MDDSSSNGKKIAEIFSDLGITMTEENGELKSSFDLLKSLSRQWSDLDGDTQKYIASTIAGEFRPFEVN